MSWVFAFPCLRAEPAVVERAATATRTVRRVTDTVELLAAADGGTADIAWIAARFPHVTRDIVLRLTDRGVTVRALADPGDDVAERLAADWGIPCLTVTDRTDLAAAAATAAPSGPRRPRGARLAVTGPAGAPGRTTVACALAAAWGEGALLVDDDALAPAVGFHVGLAADPAAGVRGAARLADLGRLDPAQVLGAATRAGGITALPAAPGDRCSRALLEVCAETGRTVVVDAGAVAARLPDAATGAGIVVVAIPTVLGVRRLVDVVPVLREGDVRAMVWNQVRGPRDHGGLGRRPLSRLAELTDRLLPGVEVYGVPWDPSAAAVRGPLPTDTPAGRALAGMAQELRRSAGTAPGKGAGPLGIRVRGALRTA